ncbi:hypothetical protein GUJ93_ZPchr0011g28106 [Zizania palustris]|uniref:Prolamin-like domain-containing protein n=1 Tax=Zizania palustris TaxID=103762 RepID=A0A8J5WGE9_ZIZPA|nr:hypothetical protein GUJ93_ZPchr0011g28106 [Zizania palustris]
MARVVKLVVVAALLGDILLLAAASGGRGGTDDGAIIAVPPLVARLHASLGVAVAAGRGGGEGGGGWMMECWSAVTELRSCTNEIVLFFLNGESYLGPECCVAIRTVTRHCWPAMLASVGFTAQEADILRGFCDAEVAGGTHAPPPCSPAPAPAPALSPV